MPGCLLPHRRLIAVSGTDAKRFLQGLITIDINTLSAMPRYGLLLSPQGKFLHDFMLLTSGDTLWIDTDAHRAEELMKRLALYRLRADVQLTLLDHSVYACWDGEPPVTSAPGGIDPRLPALGYRYYNVSLVSDTESSAYALHRIRLGVPEGDEIAVDKGLPLEYGLDQLHAIDFNKGCYVGQEVTARTKFRATLRKGLYCIEGNTELPEIGTSILAGDKEAGEIRARAGRYGIAQLRSEYTASPLAANGASLTARLPDWWKTPLD